MSIGKSSISRAEKAVSKEKKTEAAAVFSVSTAPAEKTAPVVTEVSDSFCKVPVSEIVSTYSESSIACGALWKDLVTSVEKHGIIEPLILRKTGKEYRVIAGHKRLFAAKKLGIKEIDAKIIETDDEKAAMLISELSKFTADSAYLPKEKTVADLSRRTLPDYLL